MQTCELHERSARGYCPGDEEGHAAEREALLRDECLADDQGEGLCGTDPLAPAPAPETTTTVAETTTAKAPPGELPATGVDVTGLVAPALLLVALGWQIIRGGDDA